MKNAFPITGTFKELPDATSRHLGFSLVELLAVIAIMGVVLAMAVPAISSLQESIQISRAGQGVSDTLAFARQTALSRNRNIAVRFFQPSTGGPFIAMQSFLLNDDGTEEPTGRLYRLPQSIVLSDNANHFNLPKSGTNVYELPGPETVKYAEFCFRRNGGTDLDPAQYWFLTVISEREKERDIPANFIALLIEPENGAVKLSRP